MPGCQRIMSLAALLLLVGVTCFCPKPLPHPHMAPLFAETTVQVCGFKDCKRAGGGPRLEKLIHKVLEEQGLTTAIAVEGCDCQGECGYGPNLVVDGRLINNVKGKEAVLKALGIEQDRLNMVAEEDEEEKLGEEEVAGTVFEDLQWRVAKLRLEEANTRRFLKAKPRYLPYEECRKWVQAWSRWESREDWVDWIEMGEKRNPYIPARPDEYYGRLGQWISWDHFLSSEQGEESKFD